MAFAERLESLDRKKHQLEATIHEMETHPQPDEIAIHRLKKEKLAIKDEIAALLGDQATDTANEALIAAE